jgi:excisionase family DNA binding protein
MGDNSVSPIPSQIPDGEPDRLLTHKQVAEMLNVSVSTAKQLVADRNLSVVRVRPRAIRVKASVVRRYIERNASPSRDFTPFPVEQPPFVTGIREKRAWLSAKEIAEEFNVPLRSVQVLIKDGMLKSARWLGDCRRVRRKDIDAFMYRDL